MKCPTKEIFDPKVFDIYFDVDELHYLLLLNFIPQIIQEHNHTNHFIKFWADYRSAQSFYGRGICDILGIEPSIVGMELYTCLHRLFM